VDCYSQQNANNDIDSGAGPIASLYSATINLAGPATIILAG